MLWVVLWAITVILLLIFVGEVLLTEHSEGGGIFHR